MFKSIGRSLPDLSSDLRERQDWEVGTLRTLDPLLNATTFAFDPVSSILAIGTIDGTIRIFGAPGVETSLSLPSSHTPIKFLQFATNVFKLVCIDGNDKLYLWDLTAQGQLKLEASIRFDRPVTCLTLSPSHTHAFIGLETGEIRTYDLLCRRISTYVIPNAWEAYEKDLIARGMLVDTDGTSRTPVDVVVHPRNLNFIFVAYGGGIALFDLKEQKTLRTYELLIPAGAPGGSGYTDPDLLKHRRPNVSSLSVHPAGHFFAVGHVDGCIAFWAVDDAEQPLMVRTLDEVDVHKVDGEKLEQFLPDDEVSPKPPSKVHEPKEPIFKLAWSGYPNSYDPRGGETSLVILGGQFGHDSPGINVLWLPAFNPSGPPSTSASQLLHPFFRNAMRESLDPLNAYFYRTPGLAQDFLLMPQDSPHFSGAWNPTTILMLFESGEHVRAIEARQFPPLEFLVTTQLEDASQNTEQTKEVDSDSHDLSQDLATTLQSMSLIEEPKKFNLPSSLWSGPDSVIGASLFLLDRIAYETLSGASEHNPDDLPLEGGCSIPDEEISGAIKYAKFEPHRVAVTRNADLTIRFLDISVQLLIPTPHSPFTSAFPRPLPLLSIDILALAGFPEVVAHLPSNFAERARIDDVQLAIESLEVGIVLGGGEVLVYRMADRQAATARQLPDKRLLSLEHVPVNDGLRVKPYFLVKAESPVTAFAISDVGFASVAYTNGLLIVIDMRSPRVILEVGKAQQISQRHSLIHRHSPGVDPVFSLAWTISGVKSDPTPRIRLVVARASGLIQIYTLVRDKGVWSILSAPSEAEGVATPLNPGVFVLDAHSGAPCNADKAHLTAALEARPPPNTSEQAIRCLLLVVGAKGARCLADLGEDRVARVEWGQKAGHVVRAQVIERTGSYALVVFTERHEALVYSLPMLEYLHTLPLPTASSMPPSVDSTGDLLTLVPLLDAATTTVSPAARAASPTPSSTSTAAHSVLSATTSNTAATSTMGVASLSPARCLRLDSLFNTRRGYHIPLVSLTERKDGSQHTAPLAPAPVSLGPADWRSWLGGLVGSGSVTGDEIDALLAGPDRPIPEKPEPRSEHTGYKEWDAATSKAGATASSVERSKNNLYDRLHAAVSERGEMLGNLETSVNSLEQGSKNMLTQAKLLATKQTAKSWMPKF